MNDDVTVTVHREPPNATPHAIDFGYVQGELGNTRIHIPVLLTLLDDEAEVERIKNRIRALTRYEAEQGATQ